jgi:hypothetical protein
LRGLPFLLGMIAEMGDADDHSTKVRTLVLPTALRAAAAGIIATMAQHNPPIQKELLELGALKTLSESFLEVNDTNHVEDDSDGQLRAKIMQAISATVRSHSLATNVFLNLDQTPTLIAGGIGLVDEPVPQGNHSGAIRRFQPPAVVRRRTLFFLRALLTADDVTSDQIRLFSPHVVYLIDTYALRNPSDNEDPSSFYEFQELTLSLIRSLLEQRVSVNVVLSRCDPLVDRGTIVIPVLKKKIEAGADETNATVLEHWEALVPLLGSALPGSEAR